ncbi:MAG: hypothetical protein ACREI8_14555 [Myxococcota bacterium]
MDAKLVDHQRNLENAFWWVEFAYKQGNALFDAITARLSESSLPSNELRGLCNSISKTVSYRYLWLDCLWYLPSDSEPKNSAAFAALSYTSEERTGSHLLVGMAELEGQNPGLLQKPPKGEDRHWLLDEALNGSDYKGLFKVSACEHDGLLAHQPLKTSKLYHQGLKRILSAAFPVAWINSEPRMSGIVAGLFTLYESNDGKGLGQLSREEIAEATPGGAG